MPARLKHAEHLKTAHANPWSAGGQQTPAHEAPLLPCDYVGPVLTVAAVSQGCDGDAGPSSTGDAEMEVSPVTLYTGEFIRNGCGGEEGGEPVSQ